MEKKTLEIDNKPGEKTLVIGDIHQAEGYRITALYHAIISGVIGNISRVISLGDIDREKGFERMMGFQEQLRRKNIPVHHIRGNHEDSWGNYIETGDEGILREMNQPIDPDMINNERVLEFIRSVHDRIFLGKNSCIQHALISPNKDLKWPLKTAETLSATHEHMREIERPTFVVGHDHINYISEDTGEETFYPLGRYGSESPSINIDEHPRIIGVGRFDEEGNVSILETHEDKSHTVRFHKISNDPSRYQ